jgi:hypothetical protein
MWTDKHTAAAHHEDLLKVRTRVASEKFQDETPGQIGTSKQMHEYRLKVLDDMIKQAESEMAHIPAKQGDVYR